MKSISKIGVVSGLLFAIYPIEIFSKWVSIRNQSHPSCHTLINENLDIHLLKALPSADQKHLSTERKIEIIRSVEQLSFSQKLRLASKTSVLYAFNRAKHRKKYQSDPNYVKSEHIDYLLSGIPRKHHKQIMSEVSFEGAKVTRDNILEDLETARLICLQN